MKKLFLLYVAWVAIAAGAQPTPASNVGIGTTNTKRARLEVHGAVGTTSAIFGGDNAGISLQRNWPSVGFNQYYDGSGSKYISDGFALVQYLDPNAGYLAFDKFAEGLADQYATVVRRFMTIGNDGNVGIGLSPIDATLYTKSATFRGTSFTSEIYNSNTPYDEPIFINGGKTGSKVFINDIPLAVDKGCC